MTGHRHIHDRPRAESWDSLAARRCEEGSAASGIGTYQRGGRNPASVTVTNWWTAALDGRLLAAARAMRQ